MTMPSPQTSGASALTAFFRSEAAALSPVAEKQDPARGARLVLTGVVSQVSYPGGAWRHTVSVGGRDIYVDAPVRHPPSSAVRIHLAAGAVFLFSRSVDTEAGSENNRTAHGLQVSGEAERQARTSSGA
jgi:hypothetical protein